jgi:hypothetical protein
VIIRLATFLAAASVVIFASVACGGEASQPTQVEETKEEPSVQQIEEKVVEETTSVVAGPVTSYEELPEEVKAQLPEEAKQELIQKLQDAP